MLTETLLLPFRLARGLGRFLAGLLRREKAYGLQLLLALGLVMLVMGGLAGVTALTASLIGYWELFWHIAPRGLVLIAGGYAFLIGRALCAGGDGDVS